jgi:hypothetical protein
MATVALGFVVVRSRPANDWPSSEAHQQVLRTANTVAFERLEHAARSASRLAFTGRARVIRLTAPAGGCGLLGIQPRQPNIVDIKRDRLANPTGAYAHGYV